jgi:AraC-like DNA-binding protein
LPPATTHQCCVRTDRELQTGQRRVALLAHAYLDDNYAEDVTLDGLAELAGLSPSHLARLFHTEVGMPPHAYQLQVRIARAKRLLLQGAAEGCYNSVVWPTKANGVDTVDVSAHTPPAPVTPPYVYAKFFASRFMDKSIATSNYPLKGARPRICTA